jgi:hypothetical protein
LRSPTKQTQQPAISGKSEKWYIVGPLKILYKTAKTSGIGKGLIF